MAKVVLFFDDGPRGRMAVAEFAAVAAKFGLPWTAQCVNADTSSLDGATPAAAIAFDRSSRTEQVGMEYWTAADAPSIAREVAGLVARLLGGRIVADEPKPAAPAPPKKVHTVRVGRETAGRHGKGVTTVFDLPLTLDAMKDLATALKGACGTGGTVKDGRIEIQGDHRNRIVAELELRGYKVKRSGG